VKKVIAFAVITILGSLALAGCGNSSAWQNGYNYGTDNMSNFETYGLGGPKAWCERSVAAANVSTTQQLNDWIAGCVSAASGGS
jgi:hypothetical protein